MDTTNHIKKIAWLHLILLIAYLIAAFALEASLPPLLKEYLDQEFEREPTKAEDILFLITISLMVPYIWSIIGLIRTKTWAKNLFIQTTIACVVITPFWGPYVDHAISATISWANAVISGVLIALLIYTKSAFNQQLKHDAASGAV